jgi:NAD(P)-dependent dehydrogenase (short-subunit alcohol dehydrogenase family)
MADRLAGKVALVTGAGSSEPGVGNGKATAILFAREGAKVVCVDHVLERAAETVGTIESEGGVAVAVAADVTKRDQCERMAAAAIVRYGRLDILHNNVGVSARESIREVTEEEWDRVYLASDEARWVTGQVLVIDAGVTLTVRGGTG